MSINGHGVTQDFYSKGAEYWSKIDATIDGMLGGYSHVSKTDIRGSRRFLDRFISPLETAGEIKERRALDCGCGIGRVTKNVLLHYANTVDLLDCNQTFLDEAKNHIGSDIFEKRIGYSFCQSLHQFIPPSNIKYDIIWCQWVTGHLTDCDFVKFLIRCKNALKPKGLVIIKDNHTSSDEADDDTKDGSVTRPQWLFLEIFEKAGLKCVADTRQTQLPRELYPVRIFALQDPNN